jgi:hypothetical protein
MQLDDTRNSGALTHVAWDGQFAGSLCLRSISAAFCAPQWSSISRSEEITNDAERLPQSLARSVGEIKFVPSV